ncbi:hypothetical protein EVAR_51785_1 [Eumeta japonica]|uniref:Uncharacterized protein n=1 Tax=Eumeta variegata TaxID=151549 RepID=A0A4C1XC71_EUMVA|nr:hypothetical protein EVAR_51785_1 [Eumeta japonica]
MYMRVLRCMLKKDPCLEPLLLQPMHLMCASWPNHFNIEWMIYKCINIRKISEMSKEEKNQHPHQNRERDWDQNREPVRDR